MAVVVFDASVVIAHLDATDSLHEAASAALDEHDSGRYLPTSAYAEVLVGPAAGGAFERVRQDVRDLGFELVAIDATVAEIAAGIRASRPAVRLPDALVLACGEVLDADAVLTADRRWARFPRVQVIG